MRAMWVSVIGGLVASGLVAALAGFDSGKAADWATLLALSIAFPGLALTANQLRTFKKRSAASAPGVSSGEDPSSSAGAPISQQGLAFRDQLNVQGPVTIHNRHVLGVPGILGILGIVLVLAGAGVVAVSRLDSDNKRDALGPNPQPPRGVPAPRVPEPPTAGTTAETPAASPRPTTRPTNLAVTKSDTGVYTLRWNACAINGVANVSYRVILRNASSETGHPMDRNYWDMHNLAKGTWTARVFALDDDEDRRTQSPERYPERLSAAVTFRVA
ncbi:hypothetical protein AB0M02_22135 [Actinoplanes sp. NPDC051861]|uniref:hypothetical protein n=1 Tax=Actinoplanes sp. NPDC051861 TaxID=3155170 RepID=UPI0034271EA3